MSELSLQLAEEIEIPPFDFSSFLMETISLFGIEVWNWLSFIFIYLSLVFIYNNVFRNRKLPLLKLVVLYILLLLGAFLLLVFQVDANLPIIYSLLVALGMMAMVRIRQLMKGREETK